MSRVRFILYPVLALFLLIPVRLSAQEAEDNTFGGWEFIDINHDFDGSPFFAKFYFEHDNFQYKRFQDWYTRTTFGAKILPWLKADLAYDYIQYPSYATHKAVFDVMATLKEGSFSVSIRERYMHDWTPSLGTQGNILRSRLKVQYDIPDTRFSPYLAVEVFTWGDVWKRTRHYVACDFDITGKIQFEAYYMYYAFRDIPAEHVIGLGFNVDI